MAERIAIVAPERLVLRLPAPEPLAARIEAPVALVAMIPAPIDAALTLPAPQPDRLVLPESAMPRVPGIAAGGVTAELSITGTAMARARAVGAVTAEASMSAIAKARAVAAGAVAAAIGITGSAHPYATGAVTAAVAITGKAVAKLAARLRRQRRSRAPRRPSSRAPLQAQRRPVARPRSSSATGAVTTTASITGTAVVPAYPMGMDKVGTQVIPGASSGAWANAVKIIDWATRSGYPSTTIINDCLVAGAAMTVTYSAKVTFQTGGVGSLVQSTSRRTRPNSLRARNTGGTLTGTISLNPGDTLPCGAPATVAS
ncbi:hypothetical protein GS966_28785, partial [Rhodococcus hoagii]|nr:hypothetical protein [Prescottella equi]